MALKEAEKRKFYRFPLNTPLHYKIRGAAEFGSSVTKDISVGGLRFVVDKYISPSTYLMLEFNLLSKIINPIGRVKWLQPLPHSNRYQMGLEFIELEPESKNFLSDYINLRRNI